MDAQNPNENTGVMHDDLPHNDAVELRLTQPASEVAAPSLHDTPIVPPAGTAVTGPVSSATPPVLLPAPVVPGTSHEIEGATAEPLDPPLPLTDEPLPDPDYGPQDFGAEDDSYGLPPGESDGLDQHGTTPEVTWQAAEFIAHSKGTGWYVAFIGISLVVIALAYIITHEIFTVVVVTIAVGMFGFLAARKPRELNYGLTDSGILIGSKFYGYHDFIAFAIMNEGPLSSIDFVPLKRFAPMLSIYCDANVEPDVVDVLTRHLPVARHQRGAIEGLMHRIHF
jgi:hypothetical protein